MSVSHREVLFLGNEPGGGSGLGAASGCWSDGKVCSRWETPGNIWQIFLMFPVSGDLYV